MSTQAVCKPGDGGKGLTRLPDLGKPLLQFNMLQEIDQLRKKESWLRETGRSSKTLVKYPDFRVLLVAMKANTVMTGHRAEGRITIHTLLGRLRLSLPDHVTEIAAGQLVALDCGITHDIKAVNESAFLLTIAWPRGVPALATISHARPNEQASARMDDDGSPILNEQS